LTSKRQDKEPEGPGVSISLAVAGVVAAGLGLATMSFALKPLPKPGVPVVVATSVAAPTQEPTEASFRHVDAEVRALTEPAAPESRRHERVRHVLVDKASAAPVAAPAAEAAQPKPAPAQAPVASALPPKLAAVQVAKADAPPEKLCKAPQPQVLSAKTLQAALSLRYDPKLKSKSFDVPAPDQGPSDDTQRRLKLSALLANMMSN
jgi:hypothetical protein